MIVFIGRYGNGVTRRRQTVISVSIAAAADSSAAATSDFPDLRPSAKIAARDRHFRSPAKFF